ncbi:MAG: type II toxin-antitoxin system HicA family toxin [Pseudomonadales bacterium]
MKSADVIKHLQQDGWKLHHVRGSHQQFKHPDKPGRVTVPQPKKDLPIGTIRSIEQQAGVKLL